MEIALLASEGNTMEMKGKVLDAYRRYPDNILFKIALKDILLQELFQSLDPNKILKDLKKLELDYPFVKVGGVTSNIRAMAYLELAGRYFQINDKYNGWTHIDKFEIMYEKLENKLLTAEIVL